MITSEKLKKQIASYTEAIQILERKLEILQNSDLSKYIGKFYIQDMYERGTRYMYVLDAETEEDDDIQNLSFYAKGVVYDEQQEEIVFVSPEWFSDVEYGTLTEVSKEEYIESILTLVKERLEDDY